MRHGLDWYKREPRSFIDGCRSSKLTAREWAVYSLVLDLCYEGGGETPNDPGYIAGHFSDIGSAAVRNAITELVAKGKVQIEGEMIVQKRAKNEAKTRQNLSKTRAESGRIGGVSSGKSRSGFNETKDLPEARASSKTQPEKIREDIPLYPHGGDDLFGEVKRPEKPSDILAEVIGSDLAKQFVDHRKAMKKPMSVAAATLMANKLRAMRDPKAAATNSIMNGYLSVFENEPLPGPFRHKPESSLDGILNFRSKGAQ